MPGFFKGIAEGIKSAIRGGEEKEAETTDGSLRGTAPAAAPPTSATTDQSTTTGVASTSGPRTIPNTSVFSNQSNTSAVRSINPRIGGSFYTNPGGRGNGETRHIHGVGTVAQTGNARDARGPNWNSRRVGGGNIDRFTQGGAGGGGRGIAQGRGNGQGRGNAQSRGRTSIWNSRHLNNSRNGRGGGPSHGGTTTGGHRNVERGQGVNPATRAGFRQSDASLLGTAPAAAPAAAPVAAPASATTAQSTTAGATSTSGSGTIQTASISSDRSKASPFVGASGGGSTRDTRRINPGIGGPLYIYAGADVDAEGGGHGNGGGVRINGQGTTQPRNARDGGNTQGRGHSWNSGRDGGGNANRSAQGGGSNTEAAGKSRALSGSTRASNLAQDNRVSFSINNRSQYNVYLEYQRPRSGWSACDALCSVSAGTSEQVGESNSQLMAGDIVTFYAGGGLGESSQMMLDGKPITCQVTPGEFTVDEKAIPKDGRPPPAPRNKMPSVNPEVMKRRKIVRGKRPARAGTAALGADRASATGVQPRPPPRTHAAAPTKAAARQGLVSQPNSTATAPTKHSCGLSSVPATAAGARAPGGSVATTGPRPVDALAPPDEGSIPTAGTTACALFSGIALGGAHDAAAGRPAQITAFTAAKAPAPLRAGVAPTVPATGFAKEQTGSPAAPASVPSPPLGLLSRPGQAKDMSREAVSELTAGMSSNTKAVPDGSPPKKRAAVEQGEGGPKPAQMDQMSSDEEPDQNEMSCDRPAASGVSGHTPSKSPAKKKQATLGSGGQESRPKPNTPHKSPPHKGKNPSKSTSSAVLDELNVIAADDKGFDAGVDEGLGAGEDEGLGAGVDEGLGAGGDEDFGAGGDEDFGAGGDEDFGAGGDEDFDPDDDQAELGASNSAKRGTSSMPPPDVRCAIEVHNMLAYDIAIVAADGEEDFRVNSSWGRTMEDARTNLSLKKHSTYNVCYSNSIEDEEWRGKPVMKGDGEPLQVTIAELDVQVLHVYLQERDLDFSQLTFHDRDAGDYCLRNTWRSEVRELIHNGIDTITRVEWVPYKQQENVLSGGHYRFHFSSTDAAGAPPQPRTFEDVIACKDGDDYRGLTMAFLWDHCKPATIVQATCPMLMKMANWAVRYRGEINREQQDVAEGNAQGPARVVAPPPRKRGNKKRRAIANTEDTDIGAKLMSDYQKGIGFQKTAGDAGTAFLTCLPDTVHMAFKDANNKNLPNRDHLRKEAAEYIKPDKSSPPIACLDALLKPYNWIAQTHGGKFTNNPAALFRERVGRWFVVFELSYENGTKLEHAALYLADKNKLVDNTPKGRYLAIGDAERNDQKQARKEVLRFLQQETDRLDGFEMTYVRRLLSKEEQDEVKARKEQTNDDIAAKLGRRSNAIGSTILSILTHRGIVGHDDILAELEHKSVIDRPKDYVKQASQVLGKRNVGLDFDGPLNSELHSMAKLLSSESDCYFIVTLVGYKVESVVVERSEALVFDASSSRRSLFNHQISQEDGMICSQQIEELVRDYRLANDKKARGKVNKKAFKEILQKRALLDHKVERMSIAQVYRIKWQQ